MLVRKIRERIEDRILTKTVEEFLENEKLHILYIKNGVAFFSLKEKGIIRLNAVFESPVKGSDMWTITSDSVAELKRYAAKLGFRFEICEQCGAPFTKGYVSEKEGMAACEDCFELAMEETCPYGWETKLGGDGADEFWSKGFFGKEKKADVRYVDLLEI